MRPAVLLLALAMLVTGTINTVSIKFQDLKVVGRNADGSPIHFRHPAVQAAFMFLGESLCLVPYFVLRWRKWLRRRAGLEPPSKRLPRPRKYFLQRAAMFAIPALCDSIATTLLNLGLFYTNASTYQMLRGTLVLFAGMFTLIILRRRLFVHHWLGMVLISAGAAIVGAASIVYASGTAPPPPALSPSDSTGLLDLQTWQSLWATVNPVPRLRTVVTRLKEDGAADPLFGDILVVVAQGFAALQFILEEKLLGSYRMQPLVAVGLEGMWGMVLCLVALPILGRVNDSQGRPLDDLPAALREIGSDRSLLGAVVLGILSIGFFNFFGLSVTKALSGASRATIDACRTLFVWLVALWAGWETFHDLQVVGFIVLVAGSSLYNEILRSCLPHVYPPLQRARGADDDDGSVSSEDDGLPRFSGSSVTDLEAPLLGSGYGADGADAGNGSGARGGQAHAAPVAMSRQQPHVEAQFCMARSMRLGISTLSPRPLDDDAAPYLGDRMPVGDILDVSPVSRSLNQDTDSLMGGQPSGALSEEVRPAADAAPAGTGAGVGGSRQGLLIGAGWHGTASPVQAAASAVPVPPAAAGAAHPNVAAPVLPPPPAHQPAGAYGTEVEDKNEPPPEEVAHPTHAYHPGGSLQHALAAATAASEVQPATPVQPQPLETAPLAAPAPAPATPEPKAVSPPPVLSPAAAAKAPASDSGSAPSVTAPPAAPPPKAPEVQAAEASVEVSASAPPAVGLDASASAAEESEAPAEASSKPSAAGAAKPPGGGRGGGGGSKKSKKGKKK